MRSPVSTPDRKILTVVGARPHFIKAALLSKEWLRMRRIREVLVHTGQHFDPRMSRDFFDTLRLPEPDYQLGIHSLERREMIDRMVHALIPILRAERPAIVVVFGDTNTTYAGAAAAVQLDIPVAHIEAGVRSFDASMPEEQNRLFVDRVSTLLFAPSQSSVACLATEAVKGKIILSGDILKDAFRIFQSRARRPAVPLPPQFILATIHRRANVNNPKHLQEIIRALETIHRKIPVILPLHPHTRKQLETFRIHPELTIIPPVSYLEMHYLLAEAQYIITDSGGLQREAYYAGKHALVVRQRSEWIELVQAGYSLLCDPANTTTILTRFAELTKASPVSGGRYYGDGFAAQKIAQAISNFVTV